MLRFLGLLIAFVFLVPLIRAVVGMVARLFSAFTRSPGPGAVRQTSRVPAGGVLRKDPVCGTYVSEAVALKTSSGGETVYFWSEDGRKKYLAKA